MSSQPPMRGHLPTPQNDIPYTNEPPPVLKATRVAAYIKLYCIIILYFIQICSISISYCLHIYLYIIYALQQNIICYHIIITYDILNYINFNDM